MIENKIAYSPSDEALKYNVMHYVHHCHPRLTGYSIRTHSLASVQAFGGHNVSVVPSPFVEIATNMQQQINDSLIEKDRVKYINFYETIKDDWIPALSRKLWAHSFFGKGRLCQSLSTIKKRLIFEKFAEHIISIIGEPDIIHAHSPPMMAREIQNFQRSIKTYKSVYEVRGFWGLPKSQLENSHIKKIVENDAVCCKESDCAVAIGKGIADHLISCGVPASKITIVPNAVNIDKFSPRSKSQDLLDSLKLHGKIIFGYVTSVRWLEGIHLLVDAWPEVVKKLPDAVFLLIGDGDISYMQSLENQIRTKGIEDSFRILGRVPHEKITEYYSLFDIMVVPRIPIPVCQIVTPLKPLEAMAMGIAVIASDVDALKEMVEHGETGWLFEAGNSNALSKACVTLGKDEKLRNKIAEHGFKWVVENRSWDKIGEIYNGVYSDLIGKTI